MGKEINRIGIGIADCKYCDRLKKENEELKKYKNLFLKMKKFHFDERINNEKILKENEDLKDSIKRFTCQSECLRYKQYQQANQKLEKIKELCKEPNEPYYNSKCEYGIGRIDLGKEILEIIEEK